MSIYKPKGSPNWWIYITLAGGQRIRRSTGTAEKKKAQEYHDRLKASIWNQVKLGETPEHCFEEAALKMLELSEGQSDYDTKLRHIAYWSKLFPQHTLRSLTTEEIMNNLPTHTLTGKRHPITNATKNRYLATIKRVLSVAEDLGWILKKPKLSTFKEPKINVRWITQDQAYQLLNAISQNWMRDACLFALATGARATEIFSLTWDKVDLSRSMAWVTNDIAKSGKARPLPLNNEAVMLLKKRQKISSHYCFTRDTSTGKRVDQANKRILDKAAEQINIKPLRFHDLRHTWASWHVQAGTPLMVLKELGGWETIEMVQKYAHLDAGHLHQFVSATEITPVLCHSKGYDKEKAA